MALVIINLSVGRFLIASFISPNKTSVAIVLSCASSKIITLYCDKFLSMRVSLKSIPSVIYFIIVLSEHWSSNRIKYPTSSLILQPNSLATLNATDIAATRLGWVHPIRPYLA